MNCLLQNEKMTAILSQSCLTSYSYGDLPFVPRGVAGSTTQNAAEITERFEEVPDGSQGREVGLLDVVAVVDGRIWVVRHGCPGWLAGRSPALLTNPVRWHKSNSLE